MESINVRIFPVRVYSKIMRLRVVICFWEKEANNYFMKVSSNSLCIMVMANYQLKTTTIM